MHLTRIAVLGRTPRRSGGEAAWQVGCIKTYRLFIIRLVNAKHTGECTLRMFVSGLPEKQGLYDPANEHDNCGIGFVANIKNHQSHEIVRQGLTILENLTIEEKDFQDLNNAEIMKANLLKKITLSALITMNIEEKRNLGLKSIVEEVEIDPFK